jgi:hypothetical protein
MSCLVSAFRHVNDFFSMPGTVREADATKWNAAPPLGVLSDIGRATEGNTMTKLDGVPVQTRVPVSAWALAALVMLFSLLSSLSDAGGAGQVHQASMTQLLGFVRML